MTGETTIFETFLAPGWYKTCLYIVEHVEQCIGSPTFLLNGETLDDFTVAYADAGFVSPLAYMQLLGQQPCPVELVATPVFQSGEDQEPTFFDVVVRKESALIAMSDLTGCVLAMPVRTSHVEDHFLQWHGMPTVDFRKIIEAPTQAQALRMVLDGKADATAVDSRMLDIVLHNCPSMTTQLRILGTSNPSSGPLVVVATHVNSQLKRKIQQSFLTIHHKPYFEQYMREKRIERFVPVTNQQDLALHRSYREQQPRSQCLEPEAEAYMSMRVGAVAWLS